MTIWGISDLHLSFARPERRERYAARWRDHAAQIERNWRDVVVQPDLEWLGRLPGTKVLGPGNHDRWFNDVAAIRPLLRRSILAVGGDALAIRGLVVCGVAGIPTPPWDPSPSEQLTIDREVEILRLALHQAAAIREDPARPLYVLRHFPPFDIHGRPGPWVEQLERAWVTACVYGHLHLPSQWAMAVQGNVRGVRYACVAADAIGFRPLRIDAPDRAG
jgi:predicted phosphohydrolase